MPGMQNPHTPIINIVSYSYKGGSGRTTASVNIAFKLMKEGKRVVVLDMDVGAAGMHMILSHWRTEAEDKIKRNVDGVGHQMFFNRNGDAGLDVLEPSLLYISGGEDSDVPVGAQLGTGSILFLFSSNNDRTLTDLYGTSEMARNFESKYHRLQQLLAERVGGSHEQEVYLIVDAPNGITPVSLPLLKSADLVLMFYRHSLQHIQGTIEAGRKLHDYLLDELERRYMRILLVGSCVPEDLILALESAPRGATTGEYSNPYFKDMLTGYDKMRAHMRDFSQEFKGIIVPMEDAILEDDILKVLEQPLTNGQGVHRSVLKQVFASGNEWTSVKTEAKLMAIAQRIASYGPGIAQRKSPFARGG